MQLLRRSYEGRGDVSCPVCGQGFLLYWTRQSPADHPELLSVIVEALGRQHAMCGAAEAHESEPAWASGLQLSALMNRGSTAAATWGYC